jgi:hypothetical protein
MTRTVARYKRKQHQCVPGAQQELAAFIAQRRALVEEIHSVSATLCSMILYRFILMTSSRLGKNSILGSIQYSTMPVTAADVISMNFSLFLPVQGLFVALSLFSLSFPIRKRTARLSLCLSALASFFCLICLCIISYLCIQLSVLYIHSGHSQSRRCSQISVLLQSTLNINTRT